MQHDELVACIERALCETTENEYTNDEGCTCPPCERLDTACETTPWCKVYQRVRADHIAAAIERQGEGTSARIAALERALLLEQRAHGHRRICGECQEPDNPRNGCRTWREMKDAADVAHQEYQAMQPQSPGARRMVYLKCEMDGCINGERTIEGYHAGVCPVCHGEGYVEYGYVGDAEVTPQPAPADDEAAVMHVLTQCIQDEHDEAPRAQKWGEYKGSLATRILTALRTLGWGPR